MGDRNTPMDATKRLRDQEWRKAMSGGVELARLAAENAKDARIAALERENAELWAMLSWADQRLVEYEHEHARHHIQCIGPAQTSHAAVAARSIRKDVIARAALRGAK